MRINKYVANATGIGRRQADVLINEGKVKVDGVLAEQGQDIKTGQHVTLNDKPLALPATILIMLNKPTGYIVSKNGQGAPTIYSLLPKDYQELKPIGRLDKESSGLLLLTNNGDLIQSLAHPSANKEKIYEVELDKEITEGDKNKLSSGIKLDDGPSKLIIKNSSGSSLTVGLWEGRNRQIRRTFDAIGYKVTGLHRISYGKYSLGGLATEQYKEVKE